MIRVGIADDHAVYLAGLRAMVERMPGVHVIWACGSVQEALNQLSASLVDLLLIDVNFSGGPDGIAATRLIKRRWRHVKVVVLSALEHPEYREAALMAGASGFLSKGMEMADMMAAIRNAAVGVAADALLPTLDPMSATSEPRKLTGRQLEVLDRVRRGQTNREIAVELGISITTVNKHVHHLLRRLRARNRAQAAAGTNG